MTTTTSRRALLAGIASAAPVLALPAVAATMPAAPAPTSRQVSGTTAIDLLWKQCQATKREYATASRHYDQLEAELERRMPKPHPSIAYSKENDADGLQFVVPNMDPSTLHGYIWSTDIEREIEKIDQSCAGCEWVVSEWVLYPDRKHPISEQDIAGRARLTARLELSRQYENQRDQIDREIGLTKLNQKIENQILPRLGRIERRIYSTPAVTQSDLKRKLAVYDTDELDEYTAKRLLRDLRRLAKLDLLPNGARVAVQS